MKTLLWRCVNGPQLVEKGIDFIERGAVCHVEFVFPERGEAIGAHAAGGVAIRPINAYPLDLRFSASCREEQHRRAMAFLRAQVGKPYDFLAIGGILADRDWRSPERWFCSELWAATLEEGGLIHRLASPILHFTPQDALVLSSAMFEQVSGRAA